MLRRAALAVLLTFLTAALAAQAPAGWRVRVDSSQNASDPDNTPNLSFTAMGKGFRATGGPAGTFWNPSNTAKGNYTARATFTLVKPSNHTNYYGLIVGGSDLDGAGQTYLYFLVAQDGTYLVKHRAGETVRDIKGNTPHTAVRRPGADGRSVNALEVRVAGDTVSYVINGTVVHTTPRTGATARTDGIAGVRVNHVLDVQVEGFEIRAG